MDTYTISPSTNSSKKYDVVRQNSTRKISFGAYGYSDYTNPTLYPTATLIQKHAEQKKVNYIKRHSVNEDWRDLNKAGTWARYILWNKNTVHQSARDMEQRFHIKIKIK